MQECAKKQKTFIEPVTHLWFTVDHFEVWNSLYSKISRLSQIEISACKRIDVVSVLLTKLVRR